MAIFNPTQTKLISKLTIGNETYYLKDAEARELLALLGTAAKKDVAAGVGADEQGLVTGAQVQAAIAGLSGAMHFRGKVDALPESTAGYNSGDVILVGNKEYVCDGSKWVELGDESIYALKTVKIGTQSLAAEKINLSTLATDMGLKALAYKDSASGTVAGQTISGVTATGTTTGSIDVALTQTATAATLTKSDYTPAGTIAGSTTASGTVSIAKDDANGTQISGSVSAPTVTVTPSNTTIYQIATLGELPTKDADSFTPNGDDQFTAGSQAKWSAKVDDNETLSFSFTANTLPSFTQGAKASFTEGAFTRGTLPTLDKGTTVVAGIQKAEASKPVFTGDKFGATFSGTESVVSATFTGTATKVVSGVTYDKASVNAAETKFNPAAIELAVGDIAVTAKEVTVK